MFEPEAEFEAFFRRSVLTETKFIEFPTKDVKTDQNPKKNSPKTCLLCWGFVVALVSVDIIRWWDFFSQKENKTQFSSQKFIRSKQKIVRLLIMKRGFCDLRDLKMSL